MMNSQITFEIKMFYRAEFKKGIDTLTILPFKRQQNMYGYHEFSVSYSLNAFEK